MATSGEIHETDNCNRDDIVMAKVAVSPSHDPRVMSILHGERANFPFDDVPSGSRAFQQTITKIMSHA